MHEREFLSFKSKSAMINEYFESDLSAIFFILFTRSISMSELPIHDIKISKICSFFSIISIWGTNIFENMVYCTMKNLSKTLQTYSSPFSSSSSFSSSEDGCSHVSRRSISIIKASVAMSMIKNRLFIFRLYIVSNIFCI